MRRTIRRRTSLVAGLACLVTAAVPAVTASAADSETVELDSFSLHADAPSFRVRQGTEQTEVVLPQSLAQLRNGPVGYAQSATAWPGTYGGNVGSLLILAAGAPPEAAALNSPVRAEARTGSGPSEVTNTDFPGSVMHALATPEQVAADTTTGAVAVLPVGDLGRSSTRSRTGLTGGIGVSEAVSAVREVSLLDGLITIGAVTSEATATTDGLRTTVAGRTVVSELEVAGERVAVTSEGITAAGQDGPDTGAAVDAANAALKSANVVLSLSEPIAIQDGGSASYTAGSLVVQFTQSSGAVLSVILGGANVMVSAVAGEPLLALPDLPPPAAPVADVPAAPAFDIGAGDVLAPPALPDVQPVGAPPAEAPRTVAHAPLERASFPLPQPLSPVWLVLTGLGALLVGSALRKVPEAVLAGGVARPCPLEESA